MNTAVAKHGMYLPEGVFGRSKLAQAMCGGMVNMSAGSWLKVFAV